MTTHTSPEAGCSQCDRILSLLEEADGEWVGLLEIEKASNSRAIHSRINDLRKAGHIIENKVPRRGRTVLSSYRLIQPEKTV